MTELLVLVVLNANLAPVIQRWGDEVKVDVVQASCGEENAMYFPSLDLVVMCRELDHLPAAARFVLNHELGHAWMDQHDIADSERGADELALLMSTKDEAVAAAAWFDGMVDSTNPFDEHQLHSERAASFRCLAYGLHLPEQTTGICRMYAGSVREQWARLGFPL